MRFICTCYIHTLCYRDCDYYYTWLSCGFVFLPPVTKLRVCFSSRHLTRCIPPTRRQKVLLELYVILYALPLPPSKFDYCYTLRSCSFVCLPPVAKLRVYFFSMTTPPPQNAMLKHHHLNNSIPQMEALDIQHCLKGGRGRWLACILHRFPTQTTLHTRQGSSERGLDLIPMLKQKLTLSFATGWGKGASG